MFDQPDLRPINEKEYILMTDYVYYWTTSDNKASSTHMLLIPAKTITDIASIPRWAWSIVGSPDGLYRGAALIHDVLYQFRGRLPVGYQHVKLPNEPGFSEARVVWSRESADKLFANIMKEAGVSSWKMKLMYQAVRLFGGFAW